MKIRVKSVSLLLLALALIVSASCGQTGTDAPLAPRAPITQDVSFVAVGDMMISRGVARAIDAAGDPLLPFRPLGDVLKSTDFNFGNLECPISGNDNINGKGLIFNMHTKDVAGLLEYNFKVVNQANNHAMDQRFPGLQNTMRFLKERNIEYLGVGNNLDEAWTPKVIEVKGVKFGFIGACYSSVNDGGVSRNNYVARIEDHDRLKAAIAKIRGQVDFILVTMHAGVEYTRRPNQAQIDFAHAAIDGGADMVIGAHPHWIQINEQYKGKYIFYSLGNFLFDQEWSRDTKEGLALKIQVTRRADGMSLPLLSRLNRKTAVSQIELIPVILEHYSTPRHATTEEAQAIFKKIEAPSAIIKPE
jgi:poly-gamma-glutamate synthesis protein (capsule biosynthesis protein)